MTSNFPKKITNTNENWAQMECVTHLSVLGQKPQIKEMQVDSQNAQMKGPGTWQEAESPWDFQIVESLLQQSNLWEHTTYSTEMAIVGSHSMRN